MNEKFLIASDIHGSAFWCEKLIDAYKKEAPDKLLLLGDILYHGPRNPLPDGHDPKKVIALLNPLQEKILAVRGNCDSEVDQMVLSFPMLADYAMLYANERALYATHGHLHGETNPPPLSAGENMLNGHTHVPCHRPMGEAFYVNCGSVALPKENTPHSYLVFEGGKFIWKDLQTGEIFDVLSF